VSSSILSNDVIALLSDRNTITVSTGATSAYLGDERNLREYLVADEAVKQLRSAGHVVHFLLFNDDLDALTFRQLRVAVKKDPLLIDEFEPFCGKPISDIRAPYGAPGSWSQYFQGELALRLHALDCHPTILNVSQMYAKGMYAPYIKQVLLHQDRILDYLAVNFAGYRPEKLFWPVCPTCGYIDGGEVSEVDSASVRVTCHRCLCSTRLAFEELTGKLSWKLDCAARWAMFRVHLEPFSKAYLEPQTGSFAVAKGLATTFFGAQEVIPLLYGTVSMPKELGYRILDSLPSSVIRAMFVRNHRTDLDLSEERIMTEANKAEVLPGFSFTSVVKQLLPAWTCDSRDLGPLEREIFTKGLSFSRQFLGSEVQPYLPNQSDLSEIPMDILRQIQTLIQHILILRKAYGMDYSAFMGPTKTAIEKLGGHRKSVTMALRQLVGQSEGLPNSKFLFLLPIAYLQNIESLVDLYIRANQGTPVSAVVKAPVAPHTPNLRIIAGERYAADH